jgi:hypothetical protein
LGVKEVYMSQEKLYPGWFHQFRTKNGLKLRYIFILISITLIFLSFRDVRAAQKPYLLSRSSFINTFGPGDKDRDGLLDTAEKQLAKAFAPYLVFHKNEGCSNGLVVIYQITPRTPKKIYFRQVLLFPTDCMGDSHNGDSQSSSYYLVSSDGLNWVLENRRENYEWSDSQSDGRKHPKLYISKDKHRLWLTRRECASGKKNHNICGGGQEILAKYGAKYISRSNSFNTRVRLNGNVGERPYGYRFYSLKPYGFPNEDVYSEDCFCGGKKRSNHCLPYWKGLRDCADPVSTKWRVFDDNKNSLLNVSPPNISNIILRGGEGWGSSRYPTCIAFGDVDGDGKDEVGITRNSGEDTRYWILDDATHNFRVLYRGGRGWGKSRGATAIAFGDVDGDGKDEVGITRNSGKDTRYWILDDATHNFNVLYRGGRGWGKSRGATTIAFGDVDGDDKDEVAIGRGSGGNERYWILDDANRKFRILHRGGSGWGDSRGATAIAFGDVDGDDKDEVAIGRGSGGNERYWILDDANRKFRVLYRGGRDWGKSNYVTSIAFGDVNGDRKDEVGIARYYRSNSKIKRMKYAILEYRRRSFSALYYGGQTWGSSNFATDIAFGKIYRGQKMSLGVTRKAASNFRFLFAGDIKCAKTYITGGASGGSSTYSNSIAFGDVDGDGKMEAGVTRYASGNWRYIIIKFN